MKIIKIIGISAFSAFVSTFLFVGIASADVIFFGEDFAGGSLPIPNSAAAQTNFLSNLTGVGTENFEGFSDGDPLPVPINLGGSTGTLSGSGGISNAAVGETFATSGANYLAGFANTFSLVFDQAQVAFGFFATDIGDFGGQLSVSFDGGPAIDVPHRLGSGGSTNGDGLFWGIIADTAFNTVNLLNSDTSDFFGFDDFTIGTRAQVIQTPEPLTLAIFGLGLAGLGVMKRRKRIAG